MFLCTNVANTLIFVVQYSDDMQWVSVVVSDPKVSTFAMDLDSDEESADEGVEEGDDDEEDVY